jgi:hypothetical protein
MQHEPCRVKNTTLIQPPKVCAWLRSSLPDRDGRGSVELVQTSGRGAVHRRTQPAKIVRDPPWPGDGGRGPWILIGPALSHARRTHQRNSEPSNPIRSLSHKLKCQHLGTLLPSAAARQSALEHDTACSPFVTQQIPSRDSIHPTYGIPMLRPRFRSCKPIHCSPSVGDRCVWAPFIILMAVSICMRTTMATGYTCPYSV